MLSFSDLIVKNNNKNKFTSNVGPLLVNLKIQVLFVHKEAKDQYLAKD